jgi:RNA polymerase sigma factor (sigma-70 family)
MHPHANWQFSAHAGVPENRTNVESETLHYQLEQALERLAKIRGDELARQIRPILLTNLDRGRIQRFLEGNPDQVQAYVSQVADCFSTLHTYLQRLQTERDPEVWQPLYERMQTWAYNFFLRKNFAADDHTREIAIECAAEAAIHLLNSHFPYDTDFNPWAHILVQNTCRKFIHNSLKKSIVPQEKQVELEDDLADLKDPPLEVQMLMTELGAELDSALAQLSEARRNVIRMLYFDGMELEEIAQKLGKSMGAVYSLHFNALGDLRKILSAIRDKLNE